MPASKKTQRANRITANPRFGMICCSSNANDAIARMQMAPSASADRGHQSGGDRIRTCDLEVMSLASYLAAPPRGRSALWRMGVLVGKVCRDADCGRNSLFRVLVGEFRLSTAAKHGFNCRWKPLGPGSLEMHCVRIADICD